MTAWRNYNPAKESKYHSEKVTIDGETFDSRREARRWTELKLMQQAGEIRDLQRQVKFVLIPTQREPDEIGPKGGVKRGKVIEKECSYLADFCYTDARTGDQHVEDVKGFRGGEAYKTFTIKRKLMLWLFDIRVEEI